MPASSSPARTASTTSEEFWPDDPHAHARVAAAELGDEVDAGVVARGAPRAEGGGAAAQLAHGDDRLARRLGRVERALGVRAQRVRRPRSATRPRPTRWKSAHAELGLQPAHLLGQRRLGQVQLLRRGGEGAEAQAARKYSSCCNVKA